MTVSSSEGWHRWPGQGKYARPEVERRFLVRTHSLAALGAGALAGATREIEDTYLDGMSLRLRHVHAEGESVYKLTQKVRPDPADPAVVAITNLYLTADEYGRLAELPGRTLRKTRSVHPPFVVDLFHGLVEGLRLAEVEVPDLLAPLELPAWLGREVTHDDRYSGGRLAQATAADVAALLRLS